MIDCQVATVATTMALAEQNHGEELKRVCLDFISRNLSAVMLTEGYQHMITSCSSLQVRPLSSRCRSRYSGGSRWYYYQNTANAASFER